MEALTIRDIAKICGCSTSTVSRAINGDSGINKATKAKILETIEAYHFVPNNSARNLKKIESNTIALLIKGMDNTFFQEMLKLYEQELNKLEYSFIIHAVTSEQDEVTVAAELANEKKLKGLILLGGSVSSSEDPLKQIHIPYVRCTSAITAANHSGGASSVAIDDIKESHRMVNYLCEMGHKKIAAISAPGNEGSVGVLRLTGYLRALEEHGLDYDPSLVSVMSSEYEDFSIEAGYHAAKELLQSGVEFTALFCPSDIVAFGAYKAILESGKRIPEDYSVAGFDGIELGFYLQPSITTVKQPINDMVTASIDQLMKAIHGEPTEPLIFYEGTLIIRDSVKDMNQENK